MRYTTETGKRPSFEAEVPEILDLDLDLLEEPMLPEPGDVGGYYEPYCFVCSRATDHIGEHNDIPDVEYDSDLGIVRIRRTEAA